MDSSRAQLPEALIRRARAVVSGDDSTWSPPPAVDAATLILLRDRQAGPEVFLQRRVGSMKFAAGMYVFPGGKVEADDARSPIPWLTEPDTDPFERTPGSTGTGTFHALATAAVRETWEESRVQLADDGHLDPANLRPFAHWVTPEIESRRYDTRFMIAQIPSGQTGEDLGQESDRSIWIAPAEAVRQCTGGRMAMLPPTFEALQELAAFDRVEDALADAAARRPQPTMPRPVAADDGISWELVHAYTGRTLRSW